MSSKNNRIPFRKALIWIFLSTIIISGTVSIIVLYYFHIQELQFNDESFNIVAITQLGKEKGRLTDSYLMELIDLSFEKKTNLLSYNTEIAEMKLLCNPVISSAKIKKEKPGTLAINYKLRKPAFRLTDYEKATIDENGILFPIIDFFQHDSFPELTLGEGIKNLSWGEKIPENLFMTIFEINRQIKKILVDRGILLKQIDMAKLEASSLGKREITLTLCDLEKQKEWLLRINNDEIPKRLGEFLILRDYLITKKNERLLKVVDLRIPSLAFIAG